MKNLSLAPPITCQRCRATVFPYMRDGVFKAECQECGWTYGETLTLKYVGTFPSNYPKPQTMSASKRFQELCQDIEKQGKSGQLLEILEQNFADFLAYVESEEMKRCDALAIGVNTLATLAILKHI